MKSSRTPSRIGGESGPARVLIVDDNRDILLTTAVLLQTLGHEARTAATGPIALREVSAFSPHLILLDIAMPRMDGIQVAQRIRSQAAVGEPVLAALTGFGTPQIKQECAAAGFDHYLLKPVEVVALDQLIRLTRPEASPPQTFLLQAKHKEAVCAFTRSQLEFCELVLNSVKHFRTLEEKERQACRVEGVLGRVAAWLEQQNDMPDEQRHPLQKHFARLKYRLAVMRE